MKLRPLGKNVLIQPVEVRKVSAAGLHLPQGEKSGPREGLVVAAAERCTVALEPGVRVFFERNAPTVDAGGGQLLVDENHILAVLS